MMAVNVDVRFDSSRLFDCTHSTEISKLFGLAPLVRQKSTPHVISLHIPKEHARDMTYVSDILLASGVDRALVSRMIDVARALSSAEPDNDEFHSRLIESITTSLAIYKLPSGNCGALDAKSGNNVVIISSGDSQPVLHDNETRNPLSVVYESVRHQSVCSDPGDSKLQQQQHTSSHDEDAREHESVAECGCVLWWKRRCHRQAKVCESRV